MNGARTSRDGTGDVGELSGDDASFQEVTRQKK
jgi:hypothetical protein